MTRETCLSPFCLEPAAHRGLCRLHYQRLQRQGFFATGSFTCQCSTPAPTPTDMCATCRRVITELVHARRANRD